MRYIVVLLSAYVALLICMFTTITAQQNLVHVGDSENDGEMTVGEVEEVFSTTSEKFVATEEWQTIKEGQSIPRGLHVRINLATGLKEAKLMDKTEDPKIQDAEDKPHLSPSLEEALKNIATSQDEPSGNTEEGGLEHFNKQKFKSIDEIKDYFTERNVTLTTEMDIVSTLLTRMTNHSSMDAMNLQGSLDDLEFYLHQFDNAEYFTSIGGMKVLFDIIDSSVTLEVGKSAILCVGAASQSNPRVARSVMESISSSGESLVKRLFHLVVGDPGDMRLKSALFSLSSILRAYPQAWSIISDTESIKLLIKTAQNSLVPVKARVKVITLITDMLELASSPHQNNNSLTDILYKLLNELKPQSLCSASCSLLTESLSTDQIEKVLIYFRKYCLVSSCSVDACSQPLGELVRKYQAYSAAAEGEENYDRLISGMIHDVFTDCLSQLMKEQGTVRDEL